MKTLQAIIKPIVMPHWSQDLILLLPRLIGCYFLCVNFGGSKFPVPDWFIQDVAKLGFPFPTFFAWCAVLTEVVGSFLIMIGLFTRVAAFNLMVTMLVAIFLQKWDTEVWEKLPAMGFLWIALFTLVLGSGRYGVDYLLSRKINVLKPAARYVVAAMLLLGLSSAGFAQSGPVPAERVSFVLKNTLGYHRMFRVEGPGIAYGFTMNRNEKTPKNWPIGTTLYFSRDGETADQPILTVTADDAGKTLATDSRKPDVNNNLVTVRFRNNSLLPRKLMLISYRPDEPGNGTQGFMLLPGGLSRRSFPVGTKLYLATDDQVDVVMSGKRIDTEKPFMVVKKEDSEKPINVSK